MIRTPHFHHKCDECGEETTYKVVEVDDFEFSTIDKIEFVRDNDIGGPAYYDNAGVGRGHIERGDREVEWSIGIDVDEDEMEKLRDRFDDG